MFKSPVNFLQPMSTTGQLVNSLDRVAKPVEAHVKACQVVYKTSGVDVVSREIGHVEHEVDTPYLDFKVLIKRSVNYF